MAQVIYEGKDISANVDISGLTATDSCGDTADAIDAAFANSENQWSAWKPEKTNSLRIARYGFDSGQMWIDRIRQERGVLSIGAVSIPPGGKTKRTRSWERITLITLASQIASQYGLNVRFLQVPSFVYDRVDQVGRGDFGYLSERALLEGCSMKLQNGTLYLYRDFDLEGVPTAKNIDADSFCEEPRFDDSARDTFGSCTVSWQGYGGTFADPDATGPGLSVCDYPVFNSGEARRFAKNLLRSHNKKEHSAEVAIPLDTAIAAGSTVNVSGTGLNDGKYFIDTAKYDFTAEIVRLSLHRCFMRY